MPKVTLKMKSSVVFFPILLIKLIYLINGATSNDILGCGGFIKSHADIDFSKIDIKLLTKQGSLKDKIDCSPSNGYYFIPVYDKGEYILKISPPPGWSFEPEQVELNFDGKTDICSQGKDVNFVFKGFGITGKVALAGHSGGAKDVSVELKSEDGKDVRQTTTDLNGVFSFTPIIPGKYQIKASHSRWHLQKSVINVVVEGGNTELPDNSLLVSGFDVHGKLESKGQPFGNIGIALFNEQGSKLESFCDRTKIPVGVSHQKDGFASKPICYTAIDKNGDFILKSVAPGKYLAKPVIENRDIKLHITPSVVEFQVAKDTLVLNSNFEITGFSVSGRILSSQNGVGIVGAKIKLNGQDFTTTKSNGVYELENIKPGQYKLDAEFENLQFEEKTVQIWLANPVLPDIVPSAFKVCGKIISEKSYVVGITKHGSTFHTTTSSKPQTGEWCAFLPKGKFSIEVLSTEADKSSGIQFYPVQKSVDVGTEPISGITFSQLRATLNGEVTCLPDSSSNCKSAKVTLHSLDSTGKPSGLTQTTTAEGGKYSFKDILPGPYELTIPQSNLCFDSTTVLVNVNSAQETAPAFLHRGYEISIISSHWTQMQYTIRNKEPNAQASLSEKTKIMSGVNTFCVPRAGEYAITLEGCHLYDDTLPITFSTNDPNPIVFNAMAHKVGVRVLSTEAKPASLKLLVTKNGAQESVQLTPESQMVDGYYSFRFDTHLKPEEAITVVPQSNVLLFKPHQRELIGGNDCIDVAFSFIATKGLIIEGKTVPAINQVKVTLTFPKNPELKPQEGATNAAGVFKFGPVDGTVDYELTAAKESYVFTQYDRASSTFKAHKLCDVIVSVKDEAGNKLSGVLLSLSGAESYRKNLITGNDGSIKFHSLSPSQYFLRPMMKEYKFTPNSKMIEVKDGQTVNVELIGKRVAFSAFGKVSSLNGEPFPNVNLEAISDEKCMHHQEEGTSESNGQFRIRGLQPGCSYSIRPKKGDSNPNVERSIPNARAIEVGHDDVHDVKLIGISPLSFVDVIARVYSSSNEHYKSLRIQMYRKGNPDSPIFSQRVDGPLDTKSKRNTGVLVFFPRIPLDGKIYIVELKTTLSDAVYSYTLPAVPFIAESGSVAVELEFKPEIRSVDVELTKNTFSALFLVSLVAIIFFKPNGAFKILDSMYQTMQRLVQRYM